MAADQNQHRLSIHITMYISDSLYNKSSTTYTTGMGDIPYRWPGNIDSDFNLASQ